MAQKQLRPLDRCGLTLTLSLLSSRRSHFAPRSLAKSITQAIFTWMKNEKSPLYVSLYVCVFAWRRAQLAANEEKLNNSTDTCGCAGEVSRCRNTSKEATGAHIQFNFIYINQTEIGASTKQQPPLKENFKLENMISCSCIERSIFCTFL